MNRTLKGILCLVGSAFGFALMGLFVRLTDDYGTPLSCFQKGFFRNAVAAAIALALFWENAAASCRAQAGTPTPPHQAPSTKHQAPGTPHQAPSTRHQAPKKAWCILVLRAVLGTVGIFANFYALGKIPLGDAMMLNKLAPFFTVLFSWLFLKERLSLGQALCFVGALVGAACVVKPGLGILPLAPAMLGVLGGLCAGAAYACLHELGRLKMDGKFIVLFFSAFSCLASIPLGLMTYRPMTGAQMLILCGAGAGAAIGQFGITAAYRLAEPRRIAVFDYTNILFSALFGFMVFGQVPDTLSWCGFVIIIAMAFALNRVGRRASV